eukprot:2086888-Prorocentrum_lima.AAC.1
MKATTCHWPGTRQHGGRTPPPCPRKQHRRRTLETRMRPPQKRAPGVRSTDGDSNCMRCQQYG